MQQDNRSYVVINIDLLISNIKLYRSINKFKRIIAIVKANAYGHGIEIIKYIEPFIDGLGVATVNEGSLVRQITNLPILILGYLSKFEFPLLSQYGLTPCVYSTQIAEALSEYFLKENASIDCHVKINTGMNRLGICFDDLSAFKHLYDLPTLNYVGIFSHFASADCDKEFTELQSERFISAVKQCERIGYKFDFVHIANSVRSLSGNSFGNTIRIGYGMYGYGDSRLTPILSWFAKVILVYTIKPGDTVGYGRTFVAKGDCKIAVISVGYGDGYPRNLSNCGSVLYKGQTLPVIGRVCMDMIFVCANNSDIKENDTVCLIGKSGDKIITAENLGFGYEILCGISNRVERTYISEAESLRGQY